MNQGQVSSLYSCKVRHTRLIPKRYQFDVNYYWFMLNLDELSNLAQRYFPFSLNRFNFFSFYEKDYMPAFKGSSLKERVIDYLKQNKINDQVRKIELLTSVRVLGYVFNPVSYYFIETNSRKLVIIEIGNTFNEIKPYLITDDHIKNDSVEYITPKNFYISPFASMKNIMTFRLKRSAESIKINIEDKRESGELEIITSMSGVKKELCTKRLWYNFFRFPLMTIQVIALIHWHALKLLIMKIPYYKKSDESEFQKGYYVWKS
tara:strand:+ start:14198 stop:14983 length:786 start_codon:yes stop_codon:yes gene_type:complete